MFEDEAVSVCALLPQTRTTAQDLHTSALFCCPEISEFGSYAILEIGRGPLSSLTEPAIPIMAVQFNKGGLFPLTDIRPASPYL